MQAALFSRAALSDITAAQIDRLRAHVRKLPADRLDEPTLVQELRKQFELARIELASDDAVLTTNDTSTGVTVVWHLPFTGDSNLLDARPTTSTLSVPQGSVDVAARSGDRHSITCILSGGYDLDADRVRLWRDDQLRHISQWVEFVNADVDRLYSALAQEVDAALAKRREDVEAHARLADELRSL